MNLVDQAKERGYRKGTAIRYVAHAIDYVEGDYFEEVDGQVLAYAKAPEDRESFDDFTHDTLFDGFQWVEIVDLSTRTQEQKKVDDMNNIYFEEFKNKILTNIDKVEIDFEVGYCYKRLFEDELNKNNYWHQCYYFLKGLAHYYNIVCWR